MRTFFLHTLTVLLFALAITSCGGGGGGSNAPVVVQEPIRFSSNFESGSIGAIKSLDATGLSWELALRDDNGNASMPDSFRTWWFVRADGVPIGKVLHLEFSRLGFNYPFVPVYSLDGKKWDYFAEKDVSFAPGCLVAMPDTCRLIVKAAFSSPTVWIARTFPYTGTDLDTYLQSIASHPSVRTETIGYSPQRGIGMRLITLRNPTSVGSKKTVWIHARTHAAETGPSYVLEGLINAILADNALGKALRNQYVFKIVPMHNADGVYLGNYRTNATSINLENTWNFQPGQVYLNSDAPDENQLLNHYGMVPTLLDTTAPVVLALNLHASNSTPDTAAFLFPHFGSSAAKYTAAQQNLWRTQIRFIETLASEYGGRIEQPPVDGGNGFLTSAFPETWWWHHVQDAVNAITLETTYGRAGFDHWVTQQDLRDLGVALARTIATMATPVANVQARTLGTSAVPSVYRLPFKPEIYQEQH
jgi:hypothetical protein